MNSIRCRQCEHYIEANAGEGKIYGCDRSKCVFEPIAKDNSEVIEMLELLKAQARNSGANTFIWDVTLESFNFVITRAIESLDQEPTTQNDLGVDTDKLIADCEKMSFDSELFGRPIKVVALDAVKNIVKRMPSVTPQEPFINKPCVSSGVCEHDKNKVLNKIRAKIEPKCDRINSLASVLRYPAHREIQELLCDILELLQAEK